MILYICICYYGKHIRVDNTKELTHFISNCLIWSIESWTSIGGCPQGNLNGVGIRVHWIRNDLATQPKRVVTIIWRNVCDCNRGTSLIWSSTICILTWLQSKIQKRQLDSSTGNCDSPNTCFWSIKVVWKIGACYKSTWCPTDINSSSSASYKELKTRMHTSEYFFRQHVLIVMVEYRYMWSKKD